MTHGQTIYLSPEDARELARALTWGTLVLNREQATVADLVCHRFNTWPGGAVIVQGDACPDCGLPTEYSDSFGWRHRDPAAACFLYPAWGDPDPDPDQQKG